MMMKQPALSGRGVRTCCSPEEWHSLWEGGAVAFTSVPGTTFVPFNQFRTIRVRLGVIFRTNESPGSA